MPPDNTDWRNDPEVSRYVSDEWGAWPSDVAEAAVEAYKRTLKTRIEKLPHGWAETGADDGQGHREGFEACAYSAVLAVLEDDQCA